MSEYKLQPNLFSLTDTERMISHLEEMARRGWLLVRAGPYLWRYRRAEPKALTYRAAYFQKDDLCDPENPEEACTYRQAWENGGWEYVSGYDCLHIFCAEDPDLTQPQIPALTRLEGIHSCFKKREGFLWLYIAAITVLAVASALLTYGSDPVEVLADGALMLGCGILLFVSLVLGFLWIRYVRWRNKARVEAVQNGNIPGYNGLRIVQGLVALTALGLFAWMLCIQQPYDRMVSCLDVASYLIIFAAAAFTRRIKRKGNADRKERRISTITVVLLVALALGLIQDAVLKNYRPQPREEDMLCSVSQLTGQRSESLYLREEFQSSALLEDLTQYQAVDPEQEGAPTVQYRITKIKQPALTELCRENCLPQRLYDKLESRDASAWGAEQVWCKATEGEKFVYYMFYADRTVTLLVNWELTAQQIEVLAATFQGV